MGGVFTRLIDAQHDHPGRASSRCSPPRRTGRRAVDVHVLQGEREMAAYNKTLGRFQLTGIAPAPRGVPQIEVTFDIDANGIVHVSAKDLGTGNEQSIAITASSNLSEEEIKKAVDEAAQYAAEDKKRKEEVETFNQADQPDLLRPRRPSKSWADKLDPARTRRRWTSELARLQEGPRGQQRRGQIKSAMESFTQGDLRRSFGKVYQQQSAQNGAQPGPDGSAWRARQRRRHGGQRVYRQQQLIPGVKMIIG